MQLHNVYTHYHIFKKYSTIEHTQNNLIYMLFIAPNHDKKNKNYNLK